MAREKEELDKSMHSLFDNMQGDPAHRRGYRNSSFSDINLRPDGPIKAARAVLDGWYSRIPAKKQKDIWRRFRSHDNREHSSALLELLMHELLCRRCSSVTMEPLISGKTPDFLASYRGTEFFVECTVAQGSDKEFGALRRERDVLDIVEQVNAGPYALFLERQRTGASSVSRRGLTAFLEKRLSSLAALPGLDQIGTILPDVIEWEQEDWLLHFRPVIVGNSPSERTIVGQHKGPYFVEDADVLQRSLEKKAEAYPHLEHPYLVVVTQREGIGNDDDLFDALLGDAIVTLAPASGTWMTARSFDGSFGSISHPRNPHVSAVLYKRNFRSAWQIQNNWNRSIGGAHRSPAPTDWTLVHHFAPLAPLPQGIFPFAEEYVMRDGELSPIPTNRTVNDVLGLPDPWPE